MIIAQKKQDNCLKDHDYCPEDQDNCLKDITTYSVSVVNNVNCWSGCNSKTGPCERVCGVNGFCCRKGISWENKGCPLILVNVSEERRHTCVRYAQGDGRFLSFYLRVNVDKDPPIAHYS